MNRRSLLILLFILFLTAPIDAVITRTYSFQIRIPDIKIMRIIRPGYANARIDMELRAFQAGAPVDITGTAVDNTTWLQLTSIAPLNENRKVTVQVTNGTSVPLGTKLKLSAANSTTGEGARGTAYQNLELTGSSLTLIDGIGSCYTGTTNSSGYNLTYTWMPDPATINQLVAFTSYQLYVTYTFVSY